MTSNSSSSVRRSDSFILISIFILFLVSFTILYSNLPPLSAAEAAAVRIPRDISEIGPISRALSDYRDSHYFHVVGLFSFVYIFMQAFAIPGTIFLSVLAGPLFGPIFGLIIVSTVATSGSCLCFTLVNYFGRELVQSKFPAMLASVRSKLEPQRHNLFFYLLFLRISPILPNVSISVCSPILGVPLKFFASATFLGLMPANYLHLQTGIQLNALTGGTDQSDDPNATRNNLTRVAALLALAFLALLPTLFTKKLKKFDESMGAKERKNIQSSNNENGKENEENIGSAVRRSTRQRKPVSIK